jgi:hypothetical protein
MEKFIKLHTAKGNRPIIIRGDLVIYAERGDKETCVQYAGKDGISSEAKVNESPEKIFEMACERYIKIHMIENNAVACLNVSYVDCISDNNDRMVTTIEAFDWELTVNETPEKIYNMLQKAVKSNEETSTVK